MYKDCSNESLEAIRANECEVAPQSLCTKRFQRLWNEIEKGKQLAKMVADGNFNQDEVIKLAREINNNE